MGFRRCRGMGLVVAGLLLAGTGTACDWTQVLGEPGAPPPTAPQPPVTDAAAPVDGAAGYEAMCRHYCQTLEETDVLACVTSGPAADVMACQAGAPTVDSCLDLRCVPHRVDVSLCLAQCDAVAGVYDRRCPVVGPSSDPLCPASQAQHDSACRAGCVL